LATAYQEIHKELIELSKTNNSKAQYQLYKLYAKAMFNICMRMMNKKEEAEDLLQEAFTEAFIKLHTFRYESSFGAWLKRIVVNKCINEIKRRKTELVFTDEVITAPPDEEKTDQDQVQLDVERIHRAMEELPEGYRIILSLYLLEGYDHTEIAEILNISESTSKSQFLRAKRKILDIIKN
jgi:RNA polymerase sigma-70 factor (ECF subfamily)